FNLAVSHFAAHANQRLPSRMQSGYQRMSTSLEISILGLQLLEVAAGDLHYPYSLDLDITAGKRSGRKTSATLRYRILLILLALTFRWSLFLYEPVSLLAVGRSFSEGAHVASPAVLAFNLLPFNNLQRREADGSADFARKWDFSVPETDGQRWLTV